MPTAGSNGPEWLLLTFHTSCDIIHVELLQEQHRVQTKLDILQGTLDLMVLRTLFTLGSLHGYGIARRIEQVSGDHVILNQGTIYTSLVRLEQRGWIRSKWGVSENNRRAKFYKLTAAGRARFRAEAPLWHRHAEAIAVALRRASAEPA